MTAPPPELLLLPGTLCDERVFAPLVARLPGQRAIMGDMTRADDPRALAEHILAAAPPRFALLGFSLGAIVAFEMAAQAPERIVGLAIVGGNPHPVPPETFAARRAAVTHAATIGTGRYVAEELWSRYVARAATGDTALRALVTAMADKLGPDVFNTQTEVALRRRDLRAHFPAFAMPALALCGAEDSIATPDMHREIARLLPDAELAIVPGAGHFALLEAPDIVAAHVGTWLTRLSFERQTGGAPAQSMIKEAL